MRWFVAFMVFGWLLCGLIGAWWIEDKRLKTIARGPITMVHAFTDKPVSVPGTG